MKDQWPLRVGDTRASQLMYSHGVGGMLDLPHFSVLIMGLEYWEEGTAIEEPRLLAAVRRRFSSVAALRIPPRAPDVSPAEYARLRPTGVAVRTFPGWLVCTRCHRLGRADGGMFKLRASPVNPAKNHYVHEQCRESDKRRPPVAPPVRFVTACPNGHLDEFPWFWFLHRGKPCTGSMKLTDLGLPGDFGSVKLECEGCNTWRFMMDAFGEKGRGNMPRCRGLHPHLEQFESCRHPMTTVTVGSANTWFPVKTSVLSLPKKSDPLGPLLDKHWDMLSKLPEELLKMNLKAGHPADLSAAVDRGELTFEALWRQIETRKNPPQKEQPESKDLRLPEWRLLTTIEDYVQTSEFEATVEPVPEAYAHLIERVVLVERLREVSVLTGFTRLNSLDRQMEAEDDPEERVRRAPLARKNPTWLPASETRGEGIFIQFREALIDGWEKGEAVRDRKSAFFAAHQAWRSMFHSARPEADFHGMRFVFLHTFAHVLMRRMALECGYHLAALREKIYSAGVLSENGPMCGVLIFTAGSDSEGSLGGLVALGRQKRLGGFIAQTLEQGRLCSSDPLCAEHEPTLEGHPSLHGACCHACLFLPESSCECGNRYLDRSTLVATVHRGDLALFGDT